MKIYLDNNFMCHTTNDDTILTIDAPQNFDGMCANVIECMRYVPVDMQYVAPDGNVIQGAFIQCIGDADAAQREYEKQLLEQSQTELSKLKSQQEDLLESYTEGVNSI